MARTKLAATPSSIKSTNRQAAKSSKGGKDKVSERPQTSRPEPPPAPGLGQGKPAPHVVRSATVVDVEAVPQDVDSSGNVAVARPDFRMVKLRDIDPTRYQMRLQEDPLLIEQLREGIAANGTTHLPPLVLQYKETGPMPLIDGHHRNLALEQEGRDEMLCEVHHVDDDEARHMAVDRNRGRPLSNLERGLYIVTHFKRSPGQKGEGLIAAAQKLGMSQSTASEAVAAAEVFQVVDSHGVIPRNKLEGYVSHLVHIHRVEDRSMWLELTKVCVNEEMSVRTVKKAIDALSPSSRKRRAGTATADAKKGQPAISERSSAPLSDKGKSALNVEREASDSDKSSQEQQDTGDEAGQAVPVHGEVEREHEQGPGSARAGVEPTPESTAVPGQDPEALALPVSRGVSPFFHDLEGPVQECLRAISVLSQRTGLSEAVVVDAVQRAVLGGSPDTVNDVVLDLKTAPRVA